MNITTTLTEKALKNAVEDLIGGNVTSATDSEIRMSLRYSEHPQATEIVLSGTGLTVSGNSLTGGTITGAQLLNGSTVLATISDITLSATQVNSFITNGAAFESYIELLQGDDHPGSSSGVNESGDDGDDDLSGGSNDDLLQGGGGDDHLHGGHGADDLFGDSGDDDLFGGDGNDRIDGGSGDDTVHYEDSARVTLNLAKGTATDDHGKDTLVEIEHAIGSGGDDNMTGDDHGNHLQGAAGNDRLSGGNGDDDLEGGDGDDRLTGGSGNDDLTGGSGRDQMSGGAGDDSYDVSASDDKVVEGANQGDDTVTAHASFALGANVEHLILAEDGGNINGTGNKGNETLTGNSGDNILNGGKGGSDTLTGGAGDDTFVLDAKLVAGVFDTITDFTAGDDTIQLSTKVFKALSNDTLADDFIAYQSSAPLAADDDHLLRYDADTGALYYDADGAGSKAAVKFAVFGEDSHPSLSASDFHLV